ncbi:coiled-coil and C2 domain-containing protein 2A isoform X1 [Photinus pyralis]|nr:coiled-coil and C2 domain-containing protein 2A isoform X1 [Photinus pyralis]
MSSTEENIELIEIDSSTAHKPSLKSKLKLSDNKVGLSPISSPTCSSVEERLPPAKPPRRQMRKLSTGTSESQESNDIKNYTESTSSKLESGSYRERFKERFEYVKKRAGQSVSKASSTKTKSEKIKNLKRSLNLLKKENEQVNADLHSYENGKLAHANAISPSESFGFFCGENSGENETHPVDGANFEKSTEVLIAISDEVEELQFVAPENVSFNCKLSENECFWYPSSKTLQLHEKIETEEPRFLAEEGFYMANKPKIPLSHLNLLERRLLGAGDRKWFNCEGDLDLVECPKLERIYKPPSFRTAPGIKTEFVKASLEPFDSEVTHDNIIDVSIDSVTFRHHPLFSAEHVYEQKLNTLFELYQKMLSENKLERLAKRLQALRTRKTNAEAMGNTKSFALEIKQLRDLHFEEGKNARQLLISTLQTWKAIKKIRQTNEYSTTASRLLISKTKTNYTSEMETWMAKVDEVSSEILDQLESEYQAQIDRYLQDLERWKLQDVDELVDKKPKKPMKNYDFESIKEEVSADFLQSFKPPGEPEVHLDLLDDHEVTADNAKDKLRKTAVGATKIFLRVTCGKVEVCKSGAVTLTDRFTCHIDEAFSMQLVSVPESIVVEIYEQPSTLPKRKLGEVSVRIPKKGTPGQDLHLAFEKEEIVHYKHTGVGSGIELSEVFGEGNEMLYTSGAVTGKIAWDLHGELPESNLTRDVLGDNDTIDMEKLVKWARDTKADPEDPKYSTLFEYIKNYAEDFGQMAASQKTYFRRNPEMAPFEFCEMKDIDGDLRLQMLQLRNRNEPEFVGMVIPNRPKEIPSCALDDYKRRVEEEDQGLMLQTVDYDNEIDGKRFNGAKCLKQVYTKVFQQCRNAQNNLTYEDIMNEKAIPFIESFTRNLISNIINWVQLRPTKHFLSPLISRKESTKIGDLNAPVKITVNVKSALNIPPKEISSNGRLSRSSVTNEGLTNSFVVASYQGVCFQTSTKEGENPEWNEELLIPLDPINTDYLSPNSLSGHVQLMLFDEVMVKVRQQNTKMKNWLGSVDIPISAVANAPKMEGFFKVRKPTHLLGYEENRSVRGAQTYLSLRIHLEPNVPKLTQSMDELESTELPYLNQYIWEWNEKFNLDYPHRKFSALAIDVNGKTSCVTRYIRALEPPQLNTNRFNVTAEQCAQYVALIPFTDSNKFYQNVWLTTEQLLKFMIGSVTDHAIALACYLSSLELECWLLMGYGMDQGSTTYVLVREHVSESELPLYFLYDVTTATKYNVLDTNCPLQKIFCVINAQNVWANVQRTDQVEATRFEFNRGLDWLPLFSNQVTAPTHSVQQKLSYAPTPNVSLLEMKIDKKIRKRISKMRTHERTVWNYNVTKVFKSEIQNLEDEYMSLKRSSKVRLESEDLTTRSV